MEALTNGSNVVVGVKQTSRAIASGRVRVVWLAADAEPRVTDPIRELCAQGDVPCETAPSMVELGRAAGIHVGAAAAAVLRDC